MLLASDQIFSEGALKLPINASTLDLEERSNWIKSDLLDDINEEFDLIFSNHHTSQQKILTGWTEM